MMKKIKDTSVDIPKPDRHGHTPIRVSDDFGSLPGPVGQRFDEREGPSGMSLSAPAVRLCADLKVDMFGPTQIGPPGFAADHNACRQSCGASSCHVSLKPVMAATVPCLASGKSVPPSCTHHCAGVLSERLDTDVPGPVGQFTKGKRGKGTGSAKRLDSKGRGGCDSYQRMLSLLETIQPELNAVSEPEYLDLGVVLDSGAADHVVDRREAAAYELQESPGSKAGACFVAANGDAIANQRQVTLQLQMPTSKGMVPVQSTFQAARISRPPWSVGKICDAGYQVVFNKGHATILHLATGAEAGKFQRRNGLYIGQMKLKNPAHQGATDFPRQD